MSTTPTISDNPAEVIDLLKARTTIEWTYENTGGGCMVVQGLLGADYDGPRIWLTDAAEYDGTSPGYLFGYYADGDDEGTVNVCPTIDAVLDEVERAGLRRMLADMRPLAEIVAEVYPNASIEQRISMIERFISLSIMSSRFENKEGWEKYPMVANEWRTLREWFQPDTEWTDEAVARLQTALDEVDVDAWAAHNTGGDDDTLPEIIDALCAAGFTPTDDLDALPAWIADGPWMAARHQGDTIALVDHTDSAVALRHFTRSGVLVSEATFTTDRIGLRLFAHAASLWP